MACTANHNYLFLATTPLYDLSCLPEVYSRSSVRLRYSNKTVTLTMWEIPTFRHQTNYSRMPMSGFSHIAKISKHPLYAVSAFNAY